MRKLIHWCKEHLLYVVTLFLLAFIPLYPKLPLINVIRTWVYIRFEDVLIAIAALLLLWMFVRKKEFPTSALAVPIICYWIVGAISLVNALIFIFPHVTGLFPHLGLLHWVRRIEYMMLYFLAYEAFRNKPSFLPLLWTLAVSYTLVILYGFGQKFLGFPAFLTMNEEFAKGVPLRLPPTARFPSTFGGHYDLAAYLVLTIPIMGSLLVGGVKKLWQRGLFFLLTVMGLVSLLFTASRISFGVYLVVMTVMLLWQKRAILIVPMIILSFVIMNFTSGVSERFYKTFRVSDVVVDLSTGKPIGTVDSLGKDGAVLEKGESPAEENLPKGSEYIGLAGGGGGDNQIKNVQLYKSKSVTGAEGELATVSGSFLVQKALVYDISITTRFQAEWPMAIKAFQRNLLLGSGYSSLSVATDGDYHRLLGETGILGFISFLGILVVSLTLFVKRKDLLLPMEKSFVIGVYAGVVGLLANAVLIDVFEASKVAYTMWSLLGFTTAMLVAKKPFSLHYFRFLWDIATHKLTTIFYLLLVLWLVWGKSFSLYFLGDDFTWLRWAAESNIRDLVGYFTDAEGFFYRPIPKLWYFVLFSIFWLKPMAYHVLSIGLLGITVYLLYDILMLQGVRRMWAWVGAFLFSVLSIHHENVYWISGQSSLLSGFFLVLAISLMLRGCKAERYQSLWFVFSHISLFLSMLSYDGMLIAPVILAFVLWSVVKNSRVMWSYLLLIPLYWWMRTQAGALTPQGDYGYKASTFIVNSAGNLIGYSLSVLFGPSVIEKWNALRVSIRPYLHEITFVILFLVVLKSWIIYKYRSLFRKYISVFVWLGCFVISLAAYLPLGGMAERFVYIPSIFFVLGLVTFADIYTKQASRTWLGIVVFVFIATIASWNIYEVKKVGSDWQKASAVVDQTLRVVKKEAFPPGNILYFYIVDTPIRYGRAWIFPTGLVDALWHIYRSSAYYVTPVSTIEEGYKMTFPAGDRRVFIYENYELKRGIQESVE
jgi:hypothetical protein